MPTGFDSEQELPTGFESEQEMNAYRPARSNAVWSNIAWSNGCCLGQRTVKQVSMLRRKKNGMHDRRFRRAVSKRRNKAERGATALGCEM
jgi:hypothetical protein